MNTYLPSPKPRGNWELWLQVIADLYYQWHLSWIESSFQVFILHFSYIVNDKKTLYFFAEKNCECKTRTSINWQIITSGKRSFNAKLSKKKLRSHEVQKSDNFLTKIEQKKPRIYKMTSNKIFLKQIEATKIYEYKVLRKLLHSPYNWM